MIAGDSAGILGVLGGMGPLATTTFMEKVIETTPAHVDQEHVRMVVFNDPTIPDRSAAIIDGAESPVPSLRETAHELERAGVDVIAVPCNSFHYFYDDVASAVDVPIIHMVRQTAARIDALGIAEAGLLGTEGTIRAGVYHDVLEERGIEVVEPTDIGAVMDAIHRVKAGETDAAQETLEAAYETLHADGVEVVIAGCTEIPIALPHRPALVDPMDVLAHVSVRAVGALDDALPVTVTRAEPE